MLIRKTFRDFRKNFGTFFSVFLLSGLAIALFCTFEGHVLSQHVAREEFHKECRLSDIWVYGEGFTQKQLQKVRDLDFVEDAQLRTSLKGSAPDYDGVQVDLYLEDENVVNTPYYIEGEPFDPQDKDGIWIANAFAKRRNLSVGDSFTIEYEGMTFTRTIKGLIESSEYEFRQADSDVDTFLENIAIVYMSYNAFPDPGYLSYVMTLGNTMPYTEMVIRTTDAGGLVHEKELKTVLGKNYAAMIERDSVPGLARLDSELDQHQAFSYVFVLIFVGISVLVIATSMSRMVERERTQIGTMNALGMKRWKVVLHYISFSLIVSTAGALLGLLLGVAWLCPLMMKIFAQWYIVPGLHSIFHPTYLLILLLVVGASTLSAWLSCRKVLKIKPSEALRPAAPRKGKHCLFEKLPGWNNFSFTVQYNLRDISRAKLRALMCVIGTCVGMLLMVYGVGCNRLVDTMLDLNFEKVNTADYQIKFTSDTSRTRAEYLEDKLDGELVMQDQIEVSKKKDPTASEKKKETITVLEGKRLYNILDLNNEIEDMVPGKIAVSRKLAEDLDIQVGDKIYWHLYSKNDWYEGTVGVIYRNSDAQGITYLKDDYCKTDADYTPSLLLTNQNPKEIKNLKCVASVSSKKDMEESYKTSMAMVSVMVWMMLGFSTILIVVVLYNSGSLSFHEREKELATLKVMGMRSKRIRHLMTVQNIWLSLIGLLLGIPFGNVSLNAMMNSNGENFDYALSLPIGGYVVSGALVLLVSMLVSFMFSKRIRTLDMVDVLKGTE